MPQPLKDITGLTFGRLTVIRQAEMDDKGQRLWLCECSCEPGKTKEVRGSYLRAGNVKSCGCLFLETRKTAAVKHGMSYHPLFGTWTNIKTRTTNPKNRQWPSYGGRGIKLHEAWMNDVEAFILWVETNLGPRPDGMTLDRKDNDGHYEPGNLKWSTTREQNTNQRPKVTNAEVAELAELLYDLAWR